VNRNNLKEIFGESIDYRDESSDIVRDHLDSLMLFSYDTLFELSERALTIIIQNSFLNNFPISLSYINDKPRGWPDGTTWGSIGACYDPDLILVMAGAGEYGTDHIILHEIGHSIDFLFKIHTRSDAIFWYKQLYSGLSEYEKQEGMAGIEEFLANSIALRLIDRLHGFGNTRPIEFNRWIDLVISSVGRIQPKMAMSMCFVRGERCQPKSVLKELKFHSAPNVDLLCDWYPVRMVSSMGVPIFQSAEEQDLMKQKLMMG